MDDNKDLGDLEEPEGMNFKGNYRSNEGGLASLQAQQNDESDFGPAGVAFSGNDQNDIDFDLNIDLNDDFEDDESPFGGVPLTFDSEDMLAQIKQVVQEETGAAAKSENQGLSLKGNDKAAIGSIFDQIDQLDKFLTEDDDDDIGLNMGFVEDDESSLVNKHGSKNLSHSEAGITQSLEQIMSDFPGVVVQNNNFLFGDLEEEVPEQKPLENQNTSQQRQKNHLSSTSRITCSGT